MILYLGTALVAWLFAGFILGYVVGGGAKLGGPEDLRRSQDPHSRFQEGTLAVETVQRFLDEREP